MENPSDQRESWWVGTRVVLAFCIAPLGYPATIVASSAFSGWSPSELASIAWVYLLVGYSGTILVGAPLYRFLCARSLTAFWVAPLAGIVVGAVLSALVYWLVLFSLGINLPSSGEGIASIRLMTGIIGGSALSGAAVGILLWLIARPDQQMQAAQPPAASDDRSPEPYRATPTSRA
jgi:hypothetical protein